MRLLFTTTGHSGHLLPLVPVARACARAGHDVLVAAPGARAANVYRAGLAFEPLADPSELAFVRLIQSIAPLTAERAHEHVVADGFVGLGARAALPGLLDLVERWRPNVVVRETYELAGCLAAERFGIPHARVALGLAGPEEEALRCAAAPVDAMRAELGLAPDPDGERLRSALCLTAAPAALEPAGAPEVHRFRSTGEAPADVLPHGWWHGRSEPLVYVTFGSVAGSQGLFPELYGDAIAMLERLPVRLLVTIGRDRRPAELGSLPANVRVERWVAQDAVLPHASAVVCHGGYGTTLGALVHGVPLVVLPLFAGDQWHNARRVAALGAGVALGADETRCLFAPPSLSALAALPGAVRRVLHGHEHRAAARALAAEIEALPPADATVEALEAVAAVSYA